MGSDPAGVNAFPSRERRLPLRVMSSLLAGLMLVLAPGCVSFHRGYVASPGQSSSRRVENINKVSDVGLTASARRGKIVVTCAALFDTSSVERETTVTNRREKRLSVGLVPGMRREMEVAGDAGWYPFQAVLMNIVFLCIPTVSSLVIAPFGHDDASRPLLMSDMGLIGVNRYTLPATPETTTRDKDVSRNAPRRMPLAGVCISCGIPETGFAGKGVTDKRGECSFPLPASSNATVAVTLAIRDTSASPVNRLLSCKGMTTGCEVSVHP